MMTAKRTARVVLGVLALAGVAVGQTKTVRVHEPAQRRALVIGNADYAENPLENPEGDARLIERTLKELGFDEVVLKINLETHEAMVEALREFGGRLMANDLAFFYYSGHGQQAPGGDGGETWNYLLPTGYDWKTKKASVEFAALSFERVRRVLGNAQLRVMVLDACRTYKEGKSGDGGGLAPTVPASGELIAYATGPDKVATDKGDGAGIYAQELAGALRQRGVEVTNVFRNVQAGVYVRTEREQLPEHMPLIVGDLYLNGPPEVIELRSWIKEWQGLEGTEDPALRGKVAAYIKKYKDESQAREWVAKAEALWDYLGGMVERKTAAQRWAEIEDTEDEGLLEGFLKAYPDDEVYKSLAESRLEDLRRVRVQIEKKKDASAAWEAVRRAGRIGPLVAYIEKYKDVAPALASEAEGLLERLREAELKVLEAGSSWKSPLGMEFAWIPAGDFEMGSPEGEAGRDDDERQHGVRISEGFWMGRYEVTQGEWEAVMGSNPSYFKACRPRCPVENVSWEDVQGFIQKLNEDEREAGSGNRYRLPSEAEWEYAARAGSAGATPEGDLRILAKNNAPVLDGQAWYGGNSGVSYAGAFDCSEWEGKQYAAERCGPHPVGLKKANGWGLHDMLGNVWEWTADWYGEEYPSGMVTDPRGPSTGSGRVIRGGGWGGNAGSVRSADRGGGSPGGRGGDVGCRLVRTN